MFIVTVIPIGKAIGVDELSYFSSAQPEVGSLVLVPVRRKKLWAVVARVGDVKSNRGLLRSASFSLKKTENLETRHFLSREYIHALMKASSYVVQTLGALIYATCSQKLFNALVEKEVEKIDNINSDIKKNVTPPNKPETIYGSFFERMHIYREKVGAQSEGTTVILCPTVEHAIQVCANVSKNNAGNVLTTTLLTGSSTAKEISKALSAAHKNEHAQVYIITGSMLGFPFGKVAQVIIDEPSSSHFFAISKPYLNFGVLAEFFAEAHRVPCIKGEAINFEQPPKLLFDIAHQKTKNSYGEEKFSLVSTEMHRVIEKSERSFVLANRLGYATHVVCGDCGTSVICKICQSNVRLYTQSKDKNMFVCHACGTKRSAHETCVSCGSWNLKAYGLGIEKISDELSKVFPNHSVYSAQGGTKDREKIITDWLQGKKKTILVGTSSILDHIHIKGLQASTSIAISGAQLLHSPTLFSYEEAIKTISVLHEVGSETLIQTITEKDQDTKLLTHIKNSTGITEQFKVIETERKQFLYPPFGTSIVIETEERFLYKNTFRKQEGEVSAESLFALLSQWKPLVFPIVSKKKFRTAAAKLTRIILKLPLESWNTSRQDEELFNLLSKLPPSCSVTINPHSLVS